MIKRAVAICTAVLCVLLLSAAVRRALAQTLTCPCTIWTANAVPGTAAVSDGQPIEVGVKFRSDAARFITAIRFYKGAQNIGAHVGHLWSASGALLAEATFTGELPAGWQEVQLSPA